MAGLVLVLAPNPGRRAPWAATIASEAARRPAAVTVARGADEAGTFLLADGLVTAPLVLAWARSRRALRSGRAPVGA